MARARIEIGGRYGNQITFKGNKKFLPAGIRSIITDYFNNWGNLKDIASYPNLIEKLGQAGADRQFPDTDWEKLNELYQQHMLRYTLVFSAMRAAPVGQAADIRGSAGASPAILMGGRASVPAINGGQGRPPSPGPPAPQAEVAFTVKPATAKAASPLVSILAEYAGPDGRLRDNFDIWRLEKLLRRAKAQLKFDRGFSAALKQFGATAVSLEESLSFFRQIQVYHAPDFLQAGLHKVLKRSMDKVHTLLRPTELPALAKELRSAGAHLRVHPTVKPVLGHYAELERRGRTTEPGAETLSTTEPGAGTLSTAKPGAGTYYPPVESVLSGALSAKLYPFQREGVAFLTLNGRALLADDMGLGKTLQAIGGALYLKRLGKVRRAIIICPASIKYQWQSEIQRFTSERCEVIGGDKAERQEAYRAAAAVGAGLRPALGGSVPRPYSEEERPFFYVLNYELVYRDLDSLKALKAELLILDEAQRVKNFRTKTAKAVFELDAPYLFVLTGTPLENQLMELYTIMRFIDDRALGKNPIAFRDRYVVTDRFGGIVGYRLVEEVSRKIASLTLRRTKEQALDQLPPLVETQRWLELSEVQRKIYRELHGQAREVLSAEAWDLAKANNALTLVQRLREVCDTPELIDPEHRESQKLAELLAILEDEVGVLDRQVIIFTQWTRMGKILVRELGQAGYSPSFLHGGLKARERQELVARFAEGKDRVFISTDAGGLGLNLQAASLVVNFDLPFNPAKLNQRIARAHRMGQERTVFVINLLCRATIEERLLRILKKKQELFDDVFGDITDPSQARLSGKQLSMRELLSELIE
ncbi:DEAD/DEAH box helicase [bacterium]|nr:DEAD/DEAH box helicase [bacterium]